MAVHCTRKAQRHSLPSNYCHAQSTVHQAASSSFCSAQASEQGPLYPTLRANPFPKVTDLFCRLPLPTLLYTPEAANLGDLMRSLVRPGVRIMTSFGVSRTSRSTPVTPENKVLCPSFSPITSQTDFRAQDHLKEKENASQGFYMHSQIHLCYHGISTSWLRNVNPKPCRDPKQSLHTRSIPCSQDRLTHVQLLFTWNPSPLQSSKFSFEYLLRPTSSALGNATPRLRPSLQGLVPPYSLMRAFATVVEYRPHA